MTHHVNDDLSVEVYDEITADQDIDEGDQLYIFSTNDPIEVKESFDEGDTIMVRGYSYVTNEIRTYFLKPDERVGLWTA
jgi:hypothetical protein